MFCKQCGKELDSDARFCSSCGSATDSPTDKNTDNTQTEFFQTSNSGINTENNQSTPKKLHVLGRVGFILSCISFLISFSDLGAISVAGFIVSLIGLIKFNKNPNTYKLKGFSIAGVAIGAVSVVIFFLLIFATCALTCTLLSMPELWSTEPYFTGTLF